MPSNYEFLQLKSFISNGTLISIENYHFPFEIKRVFYIYKIPENSMRGKHAHKKCEQIIIPIFGNFDVKLDDGKQEIIYNLDNASCGLYIRPMIWLELYNFKQNSVCLVFASENYEEEDYIRDYKEFLNYSKNTRGC